MFGCKKKASIPAPVSAATEAAATSKCGCPRAAKLCTPGLCKAGMVGLTALATFGPKKLRPHVQNTLAVIGILTLLRQILRRGKGSAA